MSVVSSKNRPNRHAGFSRLYLYSLLLAFCSFLYELNLGQLLSALLGNTILQYSLVIGLFSFSLGAGAYVSDYIILSKKPSLYLFKIESLLIFIGGLSPVLLYFLDQELIKASSTVLFFLLPIYYLPVVACGFFSGFELPILLYLEKEEKSKALLIVYDYVGMFLAAVLFPLLLLPSLGIFWIGFFTAMLNALVAIDIFFNRHDKMKRKITSSMIRGEF